MWEYHFQQTSLQNDRGVALLESGKYVEALSELVEAFSSASALRRQVLVHATLDPTSFTSPAVQQCPSTLQQRLFSTSSHDNDEYSSNGDSSWPSTNSTTCNLEQSADQLFIYRRGVTISIERDDQHPRDGRFISSPQHPATPSMTTSNHSFLQNVTLLVGTVIFNMALCFHLRSRGHVTESVKHSCERLALDLYRRAIDTITDTWWVARETLGNADSICLLIVLLNNKAAIFFEDEDYGSCREVRCLLVVCLNILGCGGGTDGVIRPEKLPGQAFLDKDDVTNLYRTGFLLEAPSIAGAA